MGSQSPQCPIYRWRLLFYMISYVSGLYPVHLYKIASQFTYRHHRQHRHHRHHRHCAGTATSAQSKGLLYRIDLYNSESLRTAVEDVGGPTDWRWFDFHSRGRVCECFTVAFEVLSNITPGSVS